LFFFLFIMPTLRVGKPSSVCKPSFTRRRADHADRLRALGRQILMPCSRCEEKQLLCILAKGSSKCVECVRSAVPCDGTFSAKDYDKLQSEIVKLERARRAALDRVQREAAEATSLNRRLESLEVARTKMLERESASLTELDWEEGLNSGLTINVALNSVFDEQQLAAFLDLFDSSGSFGDRS
jgi:hypothetical protein